MRRCARSAVEALAAGESPGANDAEPPLKRNHHVLAPQRQRGGLAVFSDFPNFNAEHQSHRIALGRKCRGPRATTMNHHCQPLDDITLIRRCATPSPGGRRALSVSVRLRAVIAIVLHLQARYRKCVHFRGVRTSRSQMHAPHHLELRVRTFQAPMYALAISRQLQNCCD